MLHVGTLRSIRRKTVSLEYRCVSPSVRTASMSLCHVTNVQAHSVERIVERLHLSCNTASSVGKLATDIGDLADITCV
jgi:hypothetical protein